MNGEKLAASELWWNGPVFLYLPEDQWTNVQNIPANEITNAELIKNPTVTTHVLLNVDRAKGNWPMLDEIIDCS